MSVNNKQTLNKINGKIQKISDEQIKRAMQFVLGMFIRSFRENKEYYPACELLKYGTELFVKHTRIVSAHTNANKTRSLLLFWHYKGTNFHIVASDFGIVQRSSQNSISEEQKEKMMFNAFESLEFFTDFYAAARAITEISDQPLVFSKKQESESSEVESLEVSDKPSSYLFAVKGKNENIVATQKLKIVLQTPVSSLEPPGLEKTSNFLIPNLISTLMNMQSEVVKETSELSDIDSQIVELESTISSFLDKLEGLRLRKNQKLASISGLNERAKEIVSHA